MKLFRNYVTKRQLRSKIIFLEAEIENLQRIICAERDVKKIRRTASVSGDIPTEEVKEHLEEEIYKKIKPFIEWDISCRTMSVEKFMY